MSKVLISAVAVAGFFRCGRFFPHNGVPVGEKEFTDAQWDRLTNEKALRIAPYTGEPDAEGSAELDHQIAEAIRELGPEDFTSSGKPELKALEERLGRKVTAAERDRVFSPMEGEGFTVPAVD